MSDIELRKPDGDLLDYLEYNKDIFTADDVRTIYAEVPGHNDQDGWYWVIELQDGRFLLTSAWCDYTGWDCQSGGDSQVAESAEAAAMLAPERDSEDRAIRATLLAQMRGESPFGVETIAFAPAQEAPLLPVQLFIGGRPTPERFNSPTNGDGRRTIFVKPSGGLWTSTWQPEERLPGQGTSAWIEWMRDAEQTQWMEGKEWWLLTPDPAVRILTINTHADLVRALARYPRQHEIAFFNNRYLDFERIGADYDAIHLTEDGQEATRLEDPNLYGWDCESTLWLRWMFTDVQKIEAE